MCKKYKHIPLKRTKIQVLINNLGDVAVKAGRKEAACQKAGKSGLSTMTVEQKRGKESLVGRENNGELV